MAIKCFMLLLIMARGFSQSLDFNKILSSYTGSYGKVAARLSKALVTDDGRIYACSGKNRFAFQCNSTIAWTVPPGYFCIVQISPVADERGKRSGLGHGERSDSSGAFFSNGSLPPTSAALKAEEESHEWGSSSSSSIHTRNSSEELLWRSPFLPTATSSSSVYQRARRKEPDPSLKRAKIAEEAIASSLLEVDIQLGHGSLPTAAGYVLLHQQEDIPT